MAQSCVYVIGLDGGSWDVINRLIERGRLPNLKGLMGEGAWGDLTSTLPPVTCPAWFTFSTGLKPSHLGIYNFRGIKSGSNRVRLHTYKELQHPEFWDLLMREGFSCGIINNPLLYPRKKHLGYVVPGFITPEEGFHSYPRELMRELDEVTGGYEVDQQAINIVDDETMLDDCVRVLEKRVKAMTHLLREYPTDFFLGVFTATDRICHSFMNRAFLGEAGERDYGWEALARVYGMVDEGIGRLLEMIHEDDFLILMSDHGFAARPWNLHVNQLLKDEGLLEVKVTGKLERLGFTQRSLAKHLHRLGLMKLMDRLTPQSLRRIVPAGESRLGEFFIHDLIEMNRLDWAKTQALCLGYGNYLNTENRPEGRLSPSEAEEVKERISASLQRLEDPDGVREGISTVSPETAYMTEELIDAPDQMLMEEGGWQIRTTFTRDGEIFTRNKRAGHSRRGIFLLRHPWVEPGEVAESMSIEDLAPLILHLFGQAVPERMDGRVRLDIFKPGSPLQKEVRRSRGEPDAMGAEKARIRRRIAELKKDDSL
jgi:predicted AlkP superfamily phosphohydrolase/phosphomutase